MSTNTDIVDGEAPRLTVLSKPIANAGDTVVVTGSFTAADNLFFGNTSVAPLTKSGTEMSFVVPDGTGSAFVMVVRGGELQSNKLLFTYAIPSEREGYKIGASYYDIDTTSFYRVGPGTDYMRLDLRDKDSINPLRVHLMIIDANNPNLSFKTVLAKDSVLDVETVIAMANRKSVAGKNYFAGINGDLFNNTAGNVNFGRITNASVVDGVITNSNSSIQTYAPVFFNDNTIYFDRIMFNNWVTMADGKRQSFRVINNGRGADDLVFYNSYRGKNTGTNVFGTELGVVPVNGNWGDYVDVPVKVLSKTTRASNMGSMVIPAGGAVLSGHDIQDTLYLRNGEIGDILKITAFISNVDGVKAEQLISGDFQVLRDGMPLNGDATRSARTAVGASQDKSKIIYCVVEGAIADVSVGASRTDLADIMKLAGAYNAVNFNGGSYSTMYAKGAGYNNTGLMNLPDNTTTAPNAGNGLFAVSNAPADAAVVKLVADLYSVRVKPNGTVTPRFYGLNQYGHIVASDISGVTLTEANGSGTIAGTTFTAGTSAGYTELHATYHGLSTVIKVAIVE
ncbi:phosphodiester glycosidase family protein [Niabella beijingensis]|uniref:phosphodiester glycosidase family protein n=1 Tax=Niabella beijingensis TaxID=2872700 RepID=UPI001CBDFCE1|nr:phosphodiester glycosidase family protein [Niabella beijingensis]MBZ4191048.1 phosphodiester glycosidase family protein [Niabella beijingensis]